MAAPHRFNVLGRRNLKELRELAEAGVFQGSGVHVRVADLGAFRAASRLATGLVAFQKKYEGAFRLKIDPLKRLRAAAGVSDALRSVAKEIRDADGKIRGKGKYQRLKNLAATVRQDARRLPRPKEREVLVIANEVSRAAGAGLKSGRAGKQWLLSIADKIVTLRSAPLILHPAAPAM